MEYRYNKEKQHKSCNDEFPNFEDQKKHAKLQWLHSPLECTYFNLCIMRNTNM